jgi:hypothetical protein
MPGPDQRGGAPRVALPFLALDPNEPERAGAPAQPRD